MLDFYLKPLTTLFNKIFRIIVKSINQLILVDIFNNLVSLNLVSMLIDSMFLLSMIKKGVLWVMSEFKMRYKITKETTAY